MELLNLEEDIIDKRIVRAVKEMGFKQFSPIQEQSIPEILRLEQEKQQRLVFHFYR